MWKHGMTEWTIIITIVLLILGSSHLQAFGNSLADRMKNFKRWIKEIKNKVDKLEKI